MKTLGIIPARSGSKGVKLKNIKKLGEYPLISYTIKAALKSRLDDVIVSTDSNQIKDIAVSHNASVPFIRPKNLSGDKSNSIDVAIHALHKMESINNYKYDAIMYLQPTSPFREVGDINRCLDLLMLHDKADSVISVVDVGSFHPARMKFIENGYLIDPEFCEKTENQNRQELIQMFIRNGAIYLTKRETLLRKSFKGKNSLAYIMSQKKSTNIDSIKDFEYADWIIQNK